MLDHQRLASQIPREPFKEVVVFHMTHASAKRAIEKIGPLFESEKIVHNARDNSVTIYAPRSEIDKIILMLTHIDRPDSDLVDEIVNKATEPNSKIRR